MVKNNLLLSAQSASSAFRRYCKGHIKSFTMLGGYNLWTIIIITTISITQCGIGCIDDGKNP